MNTPNACKVLSLLLLLCEVSGFNSDEHRDHTTQEYIDSYRELAVSEMHRSGIPASIKLAQALIESDSGRSILATRANNHFGIKCKSYWEGQRYFYVDDDNIDGKPVESCFRRYGSVEESFKDHTNFLTNTERYQRLFTYETTDYKAWAEGLRQCGYATDQAYSRKLVTAIQRYSLHQWDVANPK